MPQPTLEQLVAEARACRVCAADLPLGPRPVLRVPASARLLIVGQAPGTRVHETGIPWNDPSGDRLRDWLALDQAVFYEHPAIAILPTGLCYPGRHEKGGDLPPRPECAPLWHPPLRRLLPRLELTLLVGSHAQAYYLDGKQGPKRQKTMTETVRAGGDYLPEFWPLPHPSWRSQNWLKKNLWFEKDVLPALRRRVHAILKKRDTPRK